MRLTRGAPFVKCLVVQLATAPGATCPYNLVAPGTIPIASAPVPQRCALGPTYP